MRAPKSSQAEETRDVLRRLRAEREFVLTTIEHLRKQESALTADIAVITMQLDEMEGADHACT
jgi:hypothetical protein